MKVTHWLLENNMCILCFLFSSFSLWEEEGELTTKQENKQHKNGKNSLFYQHCARVAGRLVKELAGEMRALTCSLRSEERSSRMTWGVWFVGLKGGRPGRSPGVAGGRLAWPISPAPFLTSPVPVLHPSPICVSVVFYLL